MLVSAPSPRLNSCNESNMRLDILKSLNAERAARRAAVIVTDIATGAQRFVAAADIDADPLRDILRSRLRNGKSGMEETPQGRVFLTVHVPPPRLVVTGAVHISQALAPVAGLLGYDVTIVDPRTAFASPERFPDVKLIPQWPDEALPPLGIDRYTAFAALTHDPKIDDPALLHALSRDCFYIGALGSKKTHARRLERLKAQGASEGALARIHAPIGLAIGAVSPGEIAIAILAEITASLRLAAAAFLSSPGGRGQMSSSGPHPNPSLGESRVEAGA
jgi:xanthine dehydrogenase accessory factor